MIEGERLGRWEGEIETERRTEDGRIRKSECGFRPIGAYAYAPEGMRKKRMWNKTNRS